MFKLKERTVRNRFNIFLIRIGFVVLGGLVGVVIGAVLYTYLIPFWYHLEIDVEGHNFREITLVDYFYLDNTDLSQDTVILRDDNGKYFSYYQDQWRSTEVPTIDKTKYPYNYPPCNEWKSPPPAVYLQRVQDSVGIEFAHALAITSRCYILLEDGSLHSWRRNYGFFEMMFMGMTSSVIGVFSGGVFGKRMINRKFKLLNQDEIL